MSKNSTPYNEEYLELFSHLFQKLENIIRASEYPAMRHSAIHAITQIVAENIHLFTQPYLNNFLQNIYFKIFKEIVSRYKEVVSTVKDPESTLDKDSCETCRQILTNLLKLLKRFQNQNILRELQLKFIVSECEQMLDIERSVFLFNLLTFIQGFQLDLNSGQLIKKQKWLLNALRSKL